MRAIVPGPHQTAAPASPRCVATRSWSAELLSCQAYCASYKAETSVVGFAFEAQNGVHAFASDRRVDFHARPNGLAYVPPGCDVYSRSEVGGEYLRITFQAEPFAQTPLRFSDVIDRAAIDAAYRLRRELLAPHGVDVLGCERWVQILAERAAAILKAPSSPRAAAAWMTPQRLRLVDELIEDRLESRIAVQDIADALGLSAGFFCRAFRAGVGKSPHDHIIDRRLSRARALLRHTALDLGTIALASGFSSHAHMSATFRKRLGASPSELREV
jgi:AraC family transcriptional regulator